MRTRYLLSFFVKNGPALAPSVHRRIVEFDGPPIVYESDIGARESEETEYFRDKGIEVHDLRLIACSVLPEVETVLRFPGSPG